MGIGYPKIGRARVIRIVQISLLLATLSIVTTAYAAPTQLVDESPVSISRPEPNVILVDFGRVAFGNLRLLPARNSAGTVTVHFGEDLADGRVNREPHGTVRYATTQALVEGDTPVVAAPPVNERNTEVNSSDHPPAILTPPEWGVIMPFRWAEIEGWNGELRPEQIVRQSAYLSTWDDSAAQFESSDELLNRIWELSRYSIKATTFAGLYVDGDRERIPYEADAYLNQLSHYATDNDTQMSRDTFDYLMQYSTWPTEWPPHMVLMAYADWTHTGDRQWLASRYEALKDKLLLERVGDDGLITSSWWERRRSDIVDWPKGERDDFVFTSQNTVVNAFHLVTLRRMAELARAVGKEADAISFEGMASTTNTAFQRAFFRPEAGLYRDGVGTDHSSLHANLFPLAFGLVPKEHQQAIIDWLSSRGMACSVYAAQYLLEGLFENGADVEALALISAPGDRSWRHMVDSGATITWEAWDARYKPNLDWNHAWGAAPANLLPRYVLGAQPLVAGWQTARIRPSTGNLTYASGTVPTPLGPIVIAWDNSERFTLSLALPEGMKAKV